MTVPAATFSDGTPIPEDGEFHVDPTNPMISVKYLKPWYPLGISEVFSGGNTASLGFLPDGTVLKFPYDKDDRSARRGLDIEHSILSALGNHERLVKYLGRHEYGLRFQFAENGDVRHCISAQQPGDIPVELRLRWSRQAAEALALVHSKGVIHCDIHPNNLLLG